MVDTPSHLLADVEDLPAIYRPLVRALVVMAYLTGRRQGMLRALGRNEDE